MKKLFLLTTALLLTASTFAQDTASKGYLDAIIDQSTGTISYRQNGEISKDGIQVIDMKETALNNFVSRTHPDATQTAIIDKERQDLEKLRQRILAQRERMMQPLPPMGEVH
jgi:hypothetical protein